jgi:hypothetical protein
MRVFLVALVLLLTSCFSMTKQQCFDRDWRGLGVKDGEGGRPYDRFGWYNEYARTCSKYGDITALKKQYEDGLQQGLRGYCTFDNGLSIGRKGAEYKNVCPKTLEAEFTRGFQLGTTEYVRDRKP